MRQNNSANAHQTIILRRTTMTEEKNVQNQAEEVMNEYNDQTNDEGTHFYSEVWHSDYSDSSCCC